MSKKVNLGAAVGSSTPEGDVVYVHKSWAIQDLEGKILTLLDAAIQDPVQRKALKDIARPLIWSWVMETNISRFYKLEELNALA